MKNLSNAKLMLFSYGSLLFGEVFNLIENTFSYYSMHFRGDLGIMVQFFAGTLLM